MVTSANKSCRMSQATRSTNGVRVPHSSSSSTMICVECFQAKGDGDFKLPCHDQRCHFYTPVYNGDIFHNNITSPSFNKEVGHDRKSKFCYSPHKTGADFLGGFHPGPVSTGDKTWRNEPLGQNLPHVMAQMQKTRSKSLSTASTSGAGVNIRQLLGSQTPNKEREKFHPRMMSLPDCVATDSFLGKEGGSDLVEDAFVSSSLLTSYGEREDEDRHPFEMDSAISSPFGRPTGLVDWMNYPPSTSKARSPPPVTSTLPTGSSSSNSASSNTFDMTLLKLEMTKAISSEVEQSLAVSSKSLVPSDIQKHSLGDLSGIVGLGGLVQCSETFSRKVFIGGLPQEVDEDDIKTFFVQFGSLSVDWPHKNHSRACIPPKGYAFLLFKNESSVHKLLLTCKPEGDKYFIYMPTSNVTRKKVQIRPWYVADSYHSVDSSKPIDPRKAVFVGGVPRPLKAAELAEVMTVKYGNVALIMIDSDSDLKYPKGAACVVFSSHASYIAAVSARFMQLNYGSLDKKIEIKPYVLDGQMCDECTGVQCGGKPAPFFCGSVTCLQYYCEYCWATVHSMPGRQNHRPLLKDIGDKARFY